MRRLIASVLALALMTMTTTATVASETEADAIADVQSSWLETRVSQTEERHELAQEAYDMWLEASPPCQTYASAVFTSVFMFNLSIEEETSIAFEAVRLLNDQMEELDYACRIGL